MDIREAIRKAYNEDDKVNSDLRDINENLQDTFAAIKTGAELAFVLSIIAEGWGSNPNQLRAAKLLAEAIVPAERQEELLYLMFDGLDTND